jgi:hypothetical protein
MPKRLTPSQGTAIDESQQKIKLEWRAQLIKMPCF